MCEVSLPGLSHRPQELTRPSPRPSQLSPCQNKATADSAGPGCPAAARGQPPPRSPAPPSGSAAEGTRGAAGSGGEGTARDVCPRTERERSPRWAVTLPNAVYTPEQLGQRFN